MSNTIELNGSKLTVITEARIDTNTAPNLKKDLEDSLDGVTDLVIDLCNLTYISSAGLRVLVYAQRIMDEQGTLVVKNVPDHVLEIFEMTGLANILTIE